MTKENYIFNLKKLEEDFEFERKKLARRFILANSYYKIGDLFEDHIGTIRIEKIFTKFLHYDNIPSCEYQGNEVKKDGTDKKKKKHRSAFQVNDINI